MLKEGKVDLITELDPDRETAGAVF
jgi:hypothetical protein